MTQAIDSLKKLLAKELDLKENESVEVYVYRDFHISEITILSKFDGDISGGSTWFRNEYNPKVSALILACEDFLLSFDEKPHTPLGWSTPLDLHQESVEAVINCIAKLNRV